MAVIGEHKETVLFQLLEKETVTVILCIRFDEAGDPLFEVFLGSSSAGSKN